MFTVIAAVATVTFVVMVGCFHRKMSELLVLCTYVGALVAIRRQYDSIVIPLFKHAL